MHPRHFVLYVGDSLIADFHPILAPEMIGLLVPFPHDIRAGTVIILVLSGLSKGKARTLPLGDPLECTMDHIRVDMCGLRLLKYGAGIGQVPLR